jgi:hypothetical protein
LAKPPQHTDLVALDSLFWIGFHSAIAKLRRGEIFEVLARLNLIRTRSLASLIAKTRGQPFAGVQRFEEQFPADVAPLRSTVAQYEKQACMKALRNAADLHLNLQQLLDRPTVNSHARDAVMAWLDSSDQPAESRQHHSQFGDTALPPHISQFLISAMAQFKAHPEAMGVAVSGSWLGPNDTKSAQPMDESSDLDLFVVGTDALIGDPLKQDELVRSLGPLCLAHRMRPQVDPNWVVCLYHPPLVRVDLNFVTPEDLDNRYEDPTILWECDRVISRVLSATAPSASANLWRQPTLEWMESKFWPAVDMNARQVAHGELFEAINGLEDIRAKVLAPLAAIANGRNCRGVRHFETRFPEWVAAFSETVAAYDADSCRKSLAAAVELYRQLRSSLGHTSAGEAEKTVLRALSNPGIAM